MTQGDRLQTSSPQHCKRANWHSFRPPRLWSFVIAALGNYDRRHLQNMGKVGVKQRRPRPEAKKQGGSADVAWRGERGEGRGELWVVHIGVSGGEKGSGHDTRSSC